MFRKTLLTLSLVSLATLSGGLRADDTDLYTQEGAVLPPESAPMVMFSVDYRPNLGATVCQGGVCQSLVDQGFMPVKASYDFFDLLRGALGRVLADVEGVRIGLMLNNDHRNNCAGQGLNPQELCSNGGYMAMGFSNTALTELPPPADGEKSVCAPFPDGTTLDLSACTDPARIKLLSVLWNMPTSNGVRTHSYQGKELFFEFYRYLTGGAIYNGHTGFTSYDGNEGDNRQNLDLPDEALLNAAPPIDTSKFMWDTAIEEGAGGGVIVGDPSSATGNYIEPFLPGAECTKIYTVNFMFQVSNQDDDSDAAINDSEANGGFGWGNRRNFRFEDVIGFLHNKDLAPGVSDTQNVTSYFLLKDPFFSNRTGQLYAQAGGTTALELSDNPDELVATLSDTLNEILAVSTTFVSASIPVNSFNRAEVLDNVFLALFQPNEDKRPYWFGNVKKLKLAGLSGTGTVFLADANGDPAVSAEDGRLRFSTLTFWTDPNAQDVQNFDPDKNEVPGKDGRSVDRGGAGHKITGFRSGSVNETNAMAGGRTIYYDANDTTLAAFDATSTVASALQSDLGAGTSAEALQLIKYARGIDVRDEDLDGSTTDTRPWLFASSLHSRPFPVNYGARGSHTRENPDVRILVGTNDGFMRMIRNTPATLGTGETGDAYGEEVWAFAPRRVMNVHKKLHDQAFSVGSHTYAVDEAPVVFIQENGDGTIQPGEQVWAFFGLRRGGTAYYALDISNPDNPSLMWSVHPGKAGFGNLGLTFSTPVVGRVMVSGVETPVLIFGGGYDTGYDNEGVPFDTPPAGADIYVINAATGALLRSFGVAEGLQDSVPSAVSATDLDGDGLTDRIYVGDLGGVVWRADLVNTGDPADWQITQLGSFGRRAGQPDRRFFHKPDVVKSKDANGNFDAVVLGSGNRADPLETSVDNFFYMIKDKNTLTPPPPGSIPFEQDDLADITACTDCATVADLANGWKLELEAAGEKNLATPLTLGGVVFFTSFIPQGIAEGDGCSPPEGSGRLYAVGLQSGNPLVNRDRPIQDQGDSGTPEDRYEDLNSAGIPSEVVAVPPNRILRPDLAIQPVPVSTRWRTFWYPTEEPAN